MSSRRWPRAKAGITVVAPLDTHRGVYQARDLSVGGMFLLMSRPWPEGALHQICVRYGSVSVSAQVRVVRAAPDGVAVEFVGDGTGLRAAVGTVLSAIFAQGASIDEQRQAPRLAVIALVVWRDRRREQHGQLLDLSLSGAAIACESPPPLGRSILLHLPMADTTVVPFVVDAACGCKARVVRHTACGFAVEFIGMSDTFKDAVTRLRQAARHADAVAG